MDFAAVTTGLVTDKASTLGSVLSLSSNQSFNLEDMRKSRYTQAEKARARADTQKIKRAPE